MQAALSSRTASARLKPATTPAKPQPKPISPTNSEENSTGAATGGQYRSSNAAVRSDPARWEDRCANVPIELAPLAADMEALDSARATLSCAAHSDELEAARLEIARSSKAAAQQVAERLARVEAVLYRDWFKPAEVFRTRLPAVPLMGVRDVRRASGVS